MMEIVHGISKIVPSKCLSEGWCFDEDNNLYFSTESYSLHDHKACLRKDAEGWFKCRYKQVQTQKSRTLTGV